MVYEKREYRTFARASGLVTFQVMVKETDLWISARSDLSEQAITHVKEARRSLEHYIRENPEFFSTMEPLHVDPGAPELVSAMAAAGKRAGVGPMAAVAGAIAEYVGKKLLPHSPELIVENGGDIFLASTQERVLSIYAGSSPFSHRLGIRIGPERTPMGICTSSGTVGHSKSLGETDAVTVLSSSTALADAAATAAGNLVGNAKEIQRGLDFVASVPGVQGGLIIVGDAMGGWWGDLDLVKL